MVLRYSSGPLAEILSSIWGCVGVANHGVTDLESVILNHQSMLMNLVRQGRTRRDSARRTVHTDLSSEAKRARTIAASTYHVNQQLKLRCHGHYQVKSLIL